LLAALFAIGLSRSALATEPEKAPESGQEEDKAKKLAQESQNPVSSLIQSPFQLNMAGGIGSFQRSAVILNIQPVIPIPLSKKWTLVPRLRRFDRATRGNAFRTRASDVAVTGRVPADLTLLTAPRADGAADQKLPDSVSPIQRGPTAGCNRSRARAGGGGPSGVTSRRGLLLTA
jgi:hypothetical protein